MPWNIPLLSSVALLVLMQGPKTGGSSQESSYVLECIRDMIPMQIYNDCCYRENNCTITRQQNRSSLSLANIAEIVREMDEVNTTKIINRNVRNRSIGMESDFSCNFSNVRWKNFFGFYANILEGIDCMSRMIMTNYSWAFFNSHDGGSQTTENPYNYNHDHRFYGDVLETLSEICRRQPKGRLQNCIRSELIKRCRYSMLEDRITSAPGRWNQSQRRREYYPYNSNYGNNDRHGGSGDIMDRRRYPQQLYGNRRNYGNTNYNSRTDTGDTQGYYYPRGTYNEDSDDEDIGYLDGGDSGRYK